MIHKKAFRTVLTFHGKTFSCMILEKRLFVWLPLEHSTFIATTKAIKTAYIKSRFFFFIFQKELKKQATAHYMLIHWASVSYKPLSLLICFRYVYLCISCGLMTKPIFRRREIFVTHFLRVVGIFLVNLKIILSLYVAFKE